MSALQGATRHRRSRSRERATAGLLLTYWVLRTGSPVLSNSPSPV